MLPPQNVRSADFKVAVLALVVGLLVSGCVKFNESVTAIATVGSAPPTIPQDAIAKSSNYLSPLTTTSLTSTNKYVMRVSLSPSSSQIQKNTSLGYTLLKRPATK